MRITLVTLGWLFVAAITLGAQEWKGICPNIIVEAPETIMGNGITLNISAKFEGTTQPTKNFDWTIIRDSETSTIRSKQWIKLEIGRPKDPELIIAIAQPSDLSCKGFGVSKTLAFANPGSPLILDEYQAVRWNEERARLDNAASSTEKYA